MLLLHDSVSGVHQSTYEVPKQVFGFPDLLAVFYRVKRPNSVLRIDPSNLVFRIHTFFLSITSYRSEVSWRKGKRLRPSGHSRVCVQTGVLIVPGEKN